MGSGLGPTDAESLQVTAVEVTARLLTDEHGEIKSQFVDSLNTNCSPDCEKWQSYFRVRPVDTEQIILMLDDKNAAVRWLGIYKSRFAARNDSLVMKLKNVAQSDPLMRIVRVPIAQAPGQPPVFDAYVNKFAYPIRSQAINALKGMGEVLPGNTEDGSGEIGFLKSLYMQNTNNGQDVIEAVQMLSPDDPAVVTLKQWPTNTDDAIITDFQKAARMR
jgi:hypothetical protein